MPECAVAHLPAPDVGFQDRLSRYPCESNPAHRSSHTRNHVLNNSFWILTASLLCVQGASAWATEAGNGPFAGLEGVWRRHGYGELLTIDEQALTVYQRTAVSCYPVEQIATEDAKAWFAQIRTRHNGTRLMLRLHANLNRRHYDLIGSSMRHSATGESTFDLPPLCAYGGTPRPGTPLHNFEVFWQTFADNFPFFAERGVDWPAQYRRFRPLVSSTTTNLALQEILDGLANGTNATAPR